MDTNQGNNIIGKHKFYDVPYDILLDHYTGQKMSHVKCIGA
mgnify:CR=1 FL=1